MWWRHIEKLGVRKVDEYREPEDHIAVELQFMAYLCRRTIEALNDGGRLDEVKKYLEAQRDFINNHLAFVGTRACQRHLKEC
jgi:TorA maturation chaperone TorD